MNEPTPREWIKSRSATTRAFVLSGIIAFFAAVVISLVQFGIWHSMRWGAANFLPTWMLTLIYIVSAYFGLTIFYYILGFNAALVGKLKWVSAAVLGLVATLWIAAALSHSLPQLSTLVVSSPVERDLVIHSSKNHVRVGRSMRRSYCRTHIKFGTFFEFRGGWCGIYMGAKETWTFRGEGNAFAMRIDEWAR